ncbi:secondary thiamine-phosphate synthase enzyme YjbQ [Candidatus Micrarchaeota archaeon]|nr:secondary thiamine-phosphate synthase enzyme YjbQ [Candidatus Micrarchaeota archaeon]
MKQIDIKTTQKVQIIDITGKVAVYREIKDGCIVIFVPHTTAALIVNEHEPNLEDDMMHFYTTLAKGDWHHNRVDNNAEAHLVSTTLHSSIVVPIKDGELTLGTWQSILFIELDGPKERKVYVKELTKNVS